MNQDKKCNVVYSTDPNFENNYNDMDDPDTIETFNQNVRIWLDRRGGGKILTVIKGFNGPATDLELLGKELKKRCAVGGTVKDKMIQIQGNQRDKILRILTEKGIKAKKAGG